MSKNLRINITVKGFVLTKNGTLFFHFKSNADG